MDQIIGMNAYSQIHSYLVVAVFYSNLLSKIINHLYSTDENRHESCYLDDIIWLCGWLDFI